MIILISFPTVLWTNLNTLLCIQLLGQISKATVINFPILLENFEKYT